ARGSHLEAMRMNGVRVIEADGTSFTTRPACTDRLDAVSGADTVFVTLKAHSLPAIAPALGSAVRTDSALVFAQNGGPWWVFLGGSSGGEREGASLLGRSSGSWSPSPRAG